jgi:hypothetical protein
MSFPRYPKDKPSGVEWLGEVPTVAGIFQMPSASSPAAVDSSPSATSDGTVSGALRVPSALTSSLTDAESPNGDGTWNVPATLEARP